MHCLGVDLLAFDEGGLARAEQKAAGVGGGHRLSIEEALDVLAEECRAKGGRALAIRADVGRNEDMERVAQLTIETFGGFDTWINNAGVAIYGTCEQVPLEDQRRLFDTNYWGVVYGSLFAAKHLRERGGKLINTGSVLSDMCGRPLRSKRNLQERCGPWSGADMCAAFDAAHTPQARMGVRGSGPIQGQGHALEALVVKLVFQIPSLDRCAIPLL